MRDSNSSMFATKTEGIKGGFGQMSVNTNVKSTQIEVIQMNFLEPSLNMQTFNKVIH